MAQVYLQGRCKWARLQVPDQWGNWKINLYPTPESLQKFKDLKVKNVLKRDDDGDWIAIRRPSQKIIGGKLQGLAPPVIIDKDGAPTDAAVGNGSDVTVKCDYYTYKTPQGEPGHAIRLAGIRVDSLVPYTPDKDYPEEPKELKKVVGKLNEQPKQEDLF
jgi:hypothetical protein